MKNKYVTGFLALFFGFFGVHRFYLGQRFLGVLYFIMGIASVIVSASADVPAAVIPAVLAFVDAVVFLSMPREDFDRKYNKDYYYETGDRPAYYRGQDSYAASPHKGRQPGFQALKKSGIRHFRRHRYEQAADDFERALSVQPDSIPMMYNLAATYSMLEDEDRAYYYLEEAVEMGFDQFDKIHSHDALAYLRSLPSFSVFVEEGYRRPSSVLPPAETETLQELPPLDLTEEEMQQQQGTADLLEQIVELGKLRERGILTDQEFTQQKRKILEG